MLSNDPIAFFINQLHCKPECPRLRALSGHHQTSKICAWTPLPDTHRVVHNAILRSLRAAWLSPHELPTFQRRPSSSLPPRRFVHRGPLVLVATNHVGMPSQADQWHRGRGRNS